VRPLLRRQLRLQLLQHADGVGGGAVVELVIAG
jgi:hypothetical protein